MSNATHITDPQPSRLLDVMIVTHGVDGLDRLVDLHLPVVPGVCYVVAYQGSSSLPDALRRPDIVVVPNDTIGSSNNRNCALDAVDAPFALVGDNDLTYSAEGLAALVDAFRSNPDIDIILTRYTGPDNKVYPPGPHNARIPYKGYHVTTFEIAMRTDAIRRRGLRFSPDFGIKGRLYEAGEEDFFMLQALATDLNIRFLPITVAHHPTLTTGYDTTRRCNKGVVQAQGAILYLKHGWLQAPIRFALKAWRSGGNPVSNWINLWRGAFKALANGVKC